MEKTEKRAFLMVGIGTAYQEARRLVTACMDSRIRTDYPQYEIRQAFTSRTVIEKLAEIDGIQVDSEQQALERLQAEGFTEVIVQPFQMFASDEYEQVKAVAQGYGAASGFDKTEILPCLTFWIKQEPHTIN